jgi:hypothetical protein
MITVLLLIHALISVALLGAITHQAWSVASPRRAATDASFIRRFRTVPGVGYTNAIVGLLLLASLLGCLLYPQYRIDVRPTLEDLNMRAANGVFETKEHLAALALGVLPAYWYYWKRSAVESAGSARLVLTWLIALIVWFNFLVGHVLNNIKGLLPV